MTAREDRGRDLGRLARRLVQDDVGIWRATGATERRLSFPAHGHDACFGIEDSSFWFAHRNDCITEALARQRIDGPLLDIGGGNGYVSQALERSRIETVLLEPGAQGARNARHRGLRNVVCATLEDACFEPGSFAAAGLFDVVEHVADDAGLLREVHRIVRPGGILCVTVPAHGWLWSGEDEVTGHHRRYTLPRLRSLLSRCAFSVRYETYFFAPLTVPVFLLRSLPHRLRHRSAAMVEQGAAQQHVPSPRVRRAMDGLLALELRRIRRGRRVPFGTSCLVIAVRS
jgi:SAM-dependent methyltransferase